MKKIVLLATAGALALSGCGSSEANHSEEVANGSEGIKPLPQNYNSLSEDEKTRHFVIGVNNSPMQR